MAMANARMIQGAIWRSVSANENRGTMKSEDKNTNSNETGQLFLGSRFTSAMDYARLVHIERRKGTEIDVYKRQPPWRCNHFCAPACRSQYSCVTSKNGRFPAISRT